MKSNLFIGVAAILALAACASGASEKGAAKPLPSKTVVTANNADPVSVMALSTRNLPSGSCGMLLWMVQQGKPVMMFRALQEGGAEMTVDEQPTMLQAVARNGEQRFGVFTNQDYATEDGRIKVSVRSTFGRPFDGGNYIDEAIVTVINAEGWEKIIPAAGLAGCRA
jgi:hypothetical protein